MTTSTQTYLLGLTLVAAMASPFPFVQATNVVAGQVFNALLAAQRCCVHNIMPLGLFALATSGPTNFVNLHAIFMLVSQFILEAMYIGFLEDPKADVTAQLTPVPDGLVTTIVVNIIVFHFVLLPVYLWRQWGSASTCLQITVA